MPLFNLWAWIYLPCFPNSKLFFDTENSIIHFSNTQPIWVGWYLYEPKNSEKVLGPKIKIGYAWQAKIEICYGIIFLTL